jgi:hypothetical protein
MSQLLRSLSGATNGTSSSSVSIASVAASTLTSEDLRSCKTLHLLAHLLSLLPVANRHASVLPSSSSPTHAEVSKRNDLPYLLPIDPHSHECVSLSDMVPLQRIMRIQHDASD